jgi:hypothetical protein
MSFRARIICIILGFLIVAVISFFVRRRRIYTVHAITWLSLGLLFLIMGIFPVLIEYLARLLGIYFVPTAIIAVTLGGLLFTVLHLTIIASEQHKKIRSFEKEISILKIRQK